MRTGIRLIFGILAFLLGFFSLQAAASSAPSTAQQDAVKQKLSGMQIPFIENKGQMDKSVAFYAPTFAGTVFVTKKGELVYSLPANNTDEDGTSSSVQVLTERLVAGKPVPAPLTAAATQVSYFLGNDKTKWQRGVSTQSAISLGEVWKGIDVELHAHGKNVEKFFTVRPGASVNMIQVQLDGAKSLKISQDGALDVATESGTVRFTPPVAWQEKEGKKLPVQVAYLVKGDSYSFKIGQHDASLPVIIDPLLQSTYLGGGLYESIQSIAIHPVSGDVYVAGYTASLDFPGTAGGAQPVHNGSYLDAFIARLNSSLTTLMQVSYLGGGGNDYNFGLSVHPISGDVYVAGLTGSSNFPGTAGGAQPSSHPTGDENFVARLSSDLTNLIQATYLGGSNSELGNVRLSIHPVWGNVYVAGHTYSTDFPGTAGGAQPAAAPGGSADTFIAHLNSGLTTLMQATYLGGNNAETNNSLSIHPVSGDVYVTGYTYSTDLPGTAGGAQPTFGGYQDAYIARLDSSLTTLMQATYLGGSNYDSGSSLSIHPISGDVYVAGVTYSTDLPGTAGGAQPAFGGDIDTYVARLNSGLTTLVQASFLGGIKTDSGYAMTVHPVSGDVYVAGLTYSSDLPGTAGGAQSPSGGVTDAYVARLNSGLTTLVQASFLGGTVFDIALAMTIHPVSGDVYVAGYTYSTDLPGTAGGAQPTFGGETDAFISRLTPSLARNDYTLTVAKAGTGGGGVTSADGLINCGDDCNEVYGNFRAITLTALPNEGSLFTGWTGACTNVSGDCVVSMTGRKNVTAKFNATYTLTISKRGTGTGTVTSADGLINCGTDCSENYTANTVVTLTATPSAGSTFAGWSGSCTGTASCTVTLSAAKNARATFNLQAAR